MAFPTTEIAFLPFPTGSRLEDASSHEGSVYQSVVAKAVSLKGFTCGYAGRQVEHPDTVQMFVGSFHATAITSHCPRLPSWLIDIFQQRLGRSKLAPRFCRKPRIHPFLHTCPSRPGRKKGYHVSCAVRAFPTLSAARSPHHGPRDIL